MDDPPVPEDDPPPVADDPPIVIEDDDGGATQPEFPIQGFQFEEPDTVRAADDARLVAVAETESESESASAQAYVANAERTAKNVGQGEGAPTRHLSLLSSQRLAETLDQLRNKMEDDAQLAEQKRSLITSAAEGMTIATSVGLLSLLVRTGSLLGAALSTLPLWRRVDPLVILALSDEEREKLEKDLRSAEEAEDEKDDGVGRVLDGKDSIADGSLEADDESRTGRPPRA